MLRESGFSPQLWPDAFIYTIYLKNRVYNKRATFTPYARMFGVKPDLHHIRVFGALVYVHVPKDPERLRHIDNAKIGFLLSLKEDNVGYKIYYPQEHSRKWAPDVDIDDYTVYRDRHQYSNYGRLLERQSFSNHSDDDGDENTASVDDAAFNAEALEPFIEETAATGVDASVMGDNTSDMIGNEAVDQLDDHQTEVCDKKLVHMRRQVIRATKI